MEGASPMEDRGNRIIVKVPQEILSLVPYFLDCRNKDITAIVEATNSGDFPTVAKLAHNMKGVGGAYGFDLVSEIGASLEIAVEQKNIAFILELVAALKNYLAMAVVVPE